MTSWPEFLAGFVLVCVVLLDVFGTVVVPRPAQNRLRLTLLIARLAGSSWRWTDLIKSAKPRQHAKAALGPFLLVATLVAWIAALAIGFALMLHSEPNNVRMDDFGFSEALYQATLALSTLGMINADINGSARAVVGLAGVCGFSTISLTIAFVISIQSALHKREALVLALPARAGQPLSSATVLERNDGAALATLFAQWESWSAEVWQTHLSYPVLCRFRSLAGDREWLHCLSVMLDAAAFVQAAEPPALEEARRASGFLIDTATGAVTSLYNLLGCDDAQGVARDDYDRMVEIAGEGLPRGNEPTRAAYAAIRERYAGRLRGLACKLDVAWDLN